LGTAKFIFTSIQISIDFGDQGFLIYLRAKLLRINLKVELCEAFYAPSNDIWQVFFTAEQFEGCTKNKNSISKRLSKKNFKIYFEKIINQIILFCGKRYKKVFFPDYK